MFRKYSFKDSYAFISFAIYKARIFLDNYNDVICSYDSSILRTFFYSRFHIYLFTSIKYVSEGRCFYGDDKKKIVLIYVI